MACRAVRLGYNVLLLDSDVTLFDDPYKYFKQPPFQDLVVINQEENAMQANGGVLYIQVMQASVLPVCHQGQVALCQSFASALQKDT